MLNETKKTSSPLGRDYKILASSAGISRFGTSSFELVILWVILEVTSNNAFLAGLGEGLISLSLFFSFLVGALVDSSAHKKTLAYASSMLRAIFLVSVLLGLRYNSAPMILLSIYASAFMVGFTSDILNSVRSSWTKQLMTESDYKSGMSLNNAVTSLSEGLGYVASGIFLAVGAASSFTALIIVFIFALLPLIFIKTSEAEARQSALISIREGMSFVSETKSLKQIMVIGLLVNLVLGMAGIIFTALVKIKFALPPSYISVIFSVFIIGMILGSVLVQNFTGRIGKISLLFFGLIGIMLVLISILNNILLISPFAMAIGVMIGAVNVLIGTGFLKITPVDMMARVDGAFNTFSLSAIFLSGMLGGLIIQLTSISDSILIMGIGVLIATPLWYIFKELYSISV